MTVGRPGTGSPVRRMQVAYELTRLRRAAGLSQDQAGEAIRATGSKISRVESAEVGVRERDVADLLTAYGVTDADKREALLLLVRESRKPGWWHLYRDALPSGFELYVGLEEAAKLIRVYEPQFIPGLLQTEAYMRAILRADHPEPSASDVDGSVTLRLARRKVLDGRQVPRLHFVLEEAVLRRLVGGRPTMRDQLGYLIDQTSSPVMTIQVMPFSAGAHSTMFAAFHIFELPALPRIVYSENMTSCFYLDEVEDTDPYVRAFKRVCELAAPAEHSKRLIGQVRKEL